MNDRNDVPSVSMSNTKKELLEAYQSLKQRIKSNQKDLLDAENARKQLERKLAQTEAESQTTQDPVQRLHELRASIGNELLNLAERFETELDTYKKIQSAVKSKQEDLKIIYGVEAAASDLAALIEAQQAKKKDFEDEIMSQRADFEREMKDAHDRWESEEANRKQALKEEAEQINKQRDREKEEFEYAFMRKKEQLENKLEDESQALEKEIILKRSDFEQEYQRRDAELSSREKAIAEQETETATLRKRVETFPSELEKQIKSAVADTTERLNADFGKSKALLEAKYEGEKNVLTSKLESLENMVNSYQAQMAELSMRHEQAYEKVQDIANKAVAAAKRDFVAVPVSGANKTEKAGD